MDIFYFLLSETEEIAGRFLDNLFARWQLRILLMVYSFVHIGAISVVIVVSTLSAMMIDDIWSAIQGIIKQSSSTELGLDKLLQGGGRLLRPCWSCDDW